MKQDPIAPQVNAAYNQGRIRTSVLLGLGMIAVGATTAYSGMQKNGRLDSIETAAACAPIYQSFEKEANSIPEDSATFVAERKVEYHAVNGYPHKPSLSYPSACNEDGGLVERLRAVQNTNFAERTAATTTETRGLLLAGAGALTLLLIYAQSKPKR